MEEKEKALKKEILGLQRYISSLEKYHETMGKLITVLECEVQDLKTIIKRLENQLKDRTRGHNNAIH